MKPKVSARKPVPGDAVLKESASGSRPEPLESKEQAEAESGLPDELSADKIPQNPSDLFENDEAWEKARDSLPEPPREEEVSGIPEHQVAGLPDEQEKRAEPVKLPIALRRIHDKLRDPTELYKLHLKHHHMSLSQFKKRTSALQIPRDVYEAYGKLVKKCETCQTVKSAPSRAKTSGLRSDTFGDLTFVDHGEITLPSGLEKLMFIIFYDGATNLVTARAVENQTTESIISQMTEYFEVYQLTPKVVVGDQQFMSVELEAYYARNGIKPVGIGPDTPWPNRAEAAVRLTKHQIKLMLDGLIKGFGAASLENVTYHSLVRQACMTRNSMVTYGGVTPLELAFGRRPRDIVTPENSDPAQLTGEPTDVEATAQAVKELAMRAYSTARQALDLRRDLAARLNMSEGPFSIGENVYYWNSATNARVQGDLSKQKTADGKRTGGWIKGKIVSTGTGAMVGVDLGTRIVRVNVSKLRRNADVFSDIEVPLAPLEAPKPEEAALAEGSPKSEISDSPGDHASALLTYDAKQTVDDMDISFEECHWQVTNTGKIDFLELFAGTARMSQMAAQSGLRCGQPIDLRTGFDLTNLQSQKKVIDMLDKQQPTIVFMAPVCGPFSQLQNLNSPHVREKMKRAMPMIDFCIKIAEYQSKRGRYFIIENPQTSRIWYTNSFQRLLQQYDVDWDTLRMCAFGMKDPNGYYYYKPTSLMFNIPRDVMQVIFKTCPNRNSGKQPHQHETVMGNVPGYGQRSKLAQVYPYRFCKTLAVSLAHFLNRWQYGKSNMVVEDLLSELSDEEVSCLTNALDQEYVFYTNSPYNHSKLKQDSNLRQLMTKVNSLKTGAEFHLNWANSEEKWVRTTRQQASEVRQKLVPGTVFGECILYRGTLGVTKHLKESQQGILVYWHKHNKSRAVSVQPVYELDWKQINPSTFSGVLYSHTGNSVKHDRTNDPRDVAMPDQIADTNPPDRPMPQYTWDPIDPVSPRPQPVKRSDDSVSPEKPVKSKQATPPAQVVPPSAPAPPLPVVKPTAPVVSVARHPPPRPSAALPPRRLGGDSLPQSKPKPTTVADNKGKKLESRTKYRTDTPASGSNDPMPKAKPAQPSQPTLPLAEQDGETDDSEELIPDRNNDPPSEAESDETRYYSSDEVDLVFDEKDWAYYTEDQKLCANTASFSMPRYIDGAPVDTKKVTSKVRYGSTRYVKPTRNKSDIQEDYFLLTEEDKATKLTFSFLSQKAQRKEATATEKRQMKKQFDEAKRAEYQSWLDNEVFELVDMRKLGKIKNYVTGRWVLTIK